MLDGYLGLIEYVFMWRGHVGDVHVEVFALRANLQKISRVCCSTTRPTSFLCTIHHSHNPQLLRVGS